MEQFTASEVRRQASTFGSGRVNAMLNAFADMLEAWEKVVPVAEVVREIEKPGFVHEYAALNESLTVGTKLYTHPSPSDAERLAEALRACALNWQEIAAATWRGYSVSASNVDKASANAYMHCAQDIRKALAAQENPNG